MSELATPVAAFLLNRVGFGPRPGDFERLAELGDTDEEITTAYLNAQLEPESIDDGDADARISAARYESLGLSRQATWVRYVVNEDDEADRNQPLDELERLTLLRATYSNRQLVEVLADFWHNHFNVYGADAPIRSMIMRYDRDVIRANLLGNFREMLGAVAESTCMLYYLDNYRSTDAGPNENWARELLELHTLGAENYLGSDSLQSDVPVDDDGVPVGYVDDDVYEATRAFTGWTVNEQTGELAFERDNHDRFQKQVVGRFIEADQGDFVDGNDVLDVLASHPGTARHVSRKLCRRLVTDDPPQELVDATAEVFLATSDASDQLTQVVAHILGSSEFLNSAGAKSRRPFEFAVAVLRQTETDVSFALDDELSSQFVRQYRSMGQPLFRWEPPDGYPDEDAYWNNTNSLLQRWWLANDLLASRVEVERDASDGETDEEPIERYLVDIAGPTQDAPATAEGVVDFWAQRIFGTRLVDGTRTPLVDFMAQGYDPTFDLGQTDELEERVRALVALLFMTPEYLCR